MIKIGVFDSGIGGQAIAQSLKIALPQSELIVVEDKLNAPYGTKTSKEIIDLTDRAIQPLIEADCQLIVIACNTATAYSIEYLRKKYNTHTFVGIEPMLKDASRLTSRRKIGVCATPATLSSPRYQSTKDKWASQITVVEPDCADWAKLIDANTINKHHIETIVTQLLDQGVDVIVLGCTHYHWIKQQIQDMVGDEVVVLEPSVAIATRVKSLLSDLQGAS